MFTKWSLSLLALFFIGAMLGAAVVVADSEPDIFAGDPMPPSEDPERDLTNHLLDETFQMLRHTSVLRAAEQPCGEQERCQIFASPESFLERMTNNCTRLTSTELQADAAQYDVTRPLMTGLVEVCAKIAATNTTHLTRPLSPDELATLGNAVMDSLEPIYEFAETSAQRDPGDSSHD